MFFLRRSIELDNTRSHSVKLTKVFLTVDRDYICLLEMKDWCLKTRQMAVRKNTKISFHFCLRYKD